MTAIIADVLCRKGQWIRAAEYFVDSGYRFETIILRFLEASQFLAMRTYLNHVLKKLKKLSGIEELSS